MESSLNIRCSVANGRTSLEDIYYTPPYKIMHPFMDQNRMELILMSSSAGLLGGDSFSCNIDLEDQAYLTFSSQSYEKILDTGNDRAVRRLTVNVGENATLRYMPYPAIPFTNSTFCADNQIHLKASSTFIYSDVFSCGRVGMGEKYGLKRFASKSKIYIEDQLDFLDNTYICPEEIDYQTLGMWGDYTHNGMLYIYLGASASREAFIQAVRDRLKDDYFYGVTKLNAGILIRSLGNSGDELFTMNKLVAGLLYA